MSERVPYTLDGEVLPSVTEILTMYGAGHEFLMKWANGLGKKGKDYNEELDRLALIGTCMHARIECELSGMDQFIRPEWTEPILKAAMKGIGVFREWTSDKHINVINHEKRVISPTLKIGGTYDLLCQIDDGPVILVDFKSSSAIRAKHIAQVAAYVDMVNEVEDRTIDTACILRFGRDGTSEELWVDGEILDRGRHMFLLAYQMFQLSKELCIDAKSGTHLVNRVIKTTPLQMMGTTY
jgi:hypothetical protein